jgi:hypothetical protein
MAPLRKNASLKKLAAFTRSRSNRHRHWFKKACETERKAKSDSNWSVADKASAQASQHFDAWLTLSRIAWHLERHANLPHPADADPVDFANE